jgi:N-methylhydantoinase A/oxoprolinase/acetone carboxylase beta subunit
MMSSKVHVIACGVLGLDLKSVSQRMGAAMSMEFLPGGLHGTPRELKRRLQESIDMVSRRDDIERIVIGYGICGMGTADIHARGIPLVIPRVNDCIALFLGSDSAYHDQFSRFPGTYYVAAGWVTENTSPQDKHLRTGPAPDDDTYGQYVDRFGTDNADAIRYFMNSWTRNYQRAAFIDTGVGEARQRFADLAQHMASEFNWEYEKLTGTHDLLELMLKTSDTTDAILVVPPHHVTAYDAVAKHLTAVPVWKTTSGEDHVQEVIIDEGDGPAQEATVKHGLGIDAGGTYTDVVMFDFESREVLQKAKALTTRWDFTVGINEALDQLDAELLAKAELVSVSTTLATNAIVEDLGQKAGLLIMPPYGLFESSDISHRPIAVLAGRQEITGEEIAPVDPDQILQIARDMIDTQGVKAFAVTGYASHINPAHEMEVKRIIEEATGVHVTCGHGLSDKANYRIRAETAALNARIIPHLQGLLEDVATALRERHIDAAMMVVKSDGSLMNVTTAGLRPIETMLSGPAASVAGASFLADVLDAMVVDIGGTTTDTAVIRDEQVRTSAEGASVGRWRTHVNALDLRTLGLGGDSIVGWQRGVFTIGPRRVAPMAWLANRADVGPGLDWVQGYLDHLDRATAPTTMVTFLDHPTDMTLTDIEKRLLELVHARPYSVAELTGALGCVSPSFVPLERLAQADLIQLCSLTPTDLCHANGSLDLWDADASRRMLEMLAQVARMPADIFSQRVLEQFVHQLATELFCKQVSDDRGVDEPDLSPMAEAMQGNWLGGGDEGWRVRVKLTHPIIGIGAPVGLFLPAAAKLLETEAIIPPHADVANAVGAITSSVSIRRHVRIVPNDLGMYVLEGLPEAPAIGTFTEAHDRAVAGLTELVRTLALEAGTRETRVEIRVDDRTAEMDEGRSQIFLGRVLTAQITGRPDLVRS